MLPGAGVPDVEVLAAVPVAAPRFGAATGGDPSVVFHGLVSSLFVVISREKASPHLSVGGGGRLWFKPQRVVVASQASDPGYQSRRGLNARGVRGGLTASSVRPSVIKARVRCRACPLRSNRGALTFSLMDAVPPGWVLTGAGYRGGWIGRLRATLAGVSPPPGGGIGVVPRRGSDRFHAVLDPKISRWGGTPRLRVPRELAGFAPAPICVVRSRGRRCRDSLTSRTCRGTSIRFAVVRPHDPIPGDAGSGRLGCQRAGTGPAETGGATGTEYGLFLPCQHLCSVLVAFCWWS